MIWGLPLLGSLRLFEDVLSLPDWEDDVTTFKRFNKLRNLLFHIGKPGMEYHVEKELEDMSVLEDLSERYVSLALFGDSNVYKSSYRRARAKISM